MKDPEGDTATAFHLNVYRISIGFHSNLHVPSSLRPKQSD